MQSCGNLCPVGRVAGLVRRCMMLDTPTRLHRWISAMVAWQKGSKPAWSSVTGPAPSPAPWISCG